MSASSYNPSAAASQHHRQPAYRGPVAVSTAPPGTFAPGTKVQVGNHRVVIEKYLSEGGFAHVYTVRVPKGDKYEIAVLKRVAVPDKDALANMRTEVETMKKLKGHKHIVTYIDSHASQLKGGGYEVFLLMEYCQGGGLIDFMNTRLQHRLTEPEILHIFSDVSEGVACMHYLKPPLLHRDLKVENVLISSHHSARIYKLCDFGSTAPPRPAATTAAEGRLIEDDVQRHTTLQYRSPEMIDVYRKQPIDEKSDIWALGVLLYKLCYYTTPFEEQGQMAILNATFKFPTYPSFSDRTKKLIRWMLQENPQRRPNIYQVVYEVCSMRGTPVPIKDIYSQRTASEARRNQQLPSPEPNVASPPVIGLHKAPPVQQVQAIPNITPMRRGRPTGPTQPTTSSKPSSSPMRGTASDPFAALDSNNPTVRAAAADELSARFPSLDEFSILHDKGKNFQFATQASPEPPQDEFSRRVTQALADEAFAQPLPTKSEVAPTSMSAPPTRKPSDKKPLPAQPREPSRSSQPSLLHQPTPQRPSMVSTGIQTSPPASPKMSASQFPDVNQRPIWRVPTDSSRNHSRAFSQSREIENPRKSAPTLRPDYTMPVRPVALDAHRSISQTNTLSIPKSPASSRPSLEGSRPSALDLSDSISRSKSANARPRPSSVHVESSLDYLRHRESSGGWNVPGELGRPGAEAESSSDDEPDDRNIASNVEFLRSMEGESSSKKEKRRSGSGSKHTKRGSLSSISLSGTKNILAGRFGDAFKRFENNNANSEPRTPSPLHVEQRAGPALTPIAGSEATDDHETAVDDTQDLPPEVRRELERRRLSEEEKRVADAAAEYRKRLAEGGTGKAHVGAAATGGGGSTRASTIQNRVKSLLQDSNKVSTTRTAEGYGKYTDTGKPLPDPKRSIDERARATPPPSIPRKPINVGKPAVPPKPAIKPAALRTGSGALPPQAGGTQQSAEDWEADFTKRYPSLSGLEMVETEIGKGMVRDV